MKEQIPIYEHGPFLAENSLLRQKKIQIYLTDV